MSVTRAASKLGIALIVATAALSTAAYAGKGGGGGGGGHGGGGFGGGHSLGGHSFGGFGGHSFGGNSFGGHGGTHVASAHGDSHGGHEGHGDHGGGHGGGHGADGHGGHGGSHHAGGHGGSHAGALRAPLYWLSWPFGYYVTADLSATCGEDTTDVASLPLDQYQQAIQPANDAQRAAFDDLTAAATKATQDIKAACPADLALTAPGQLAAMQQRIEAMLGAVQTVQPPLEKFYGLLNDEQKARVNALGGDQRSGETAAASANANNSQLAQKCNATQLGELQLPNAEIDKTVRPTDEQRMILVGLQNATTQAAADLIKSSCASSKPITPAAKLAAIGKRLETMLQSIKQVRLALNNFYATLSDEQKARFEAIGPQVASDEAATDDEADEPEEKPVHVTVVRKTYVHPVAPVAQIIRHFMPF